MFENILVRRCWLAFRSNRIFEIFQANCFQLSIKIFHRARRLEINPPAWVAAITTGVRALHFTNLQLLQKFDKLDDRWHVFNLTGPTSALDSLVAAVVSVERGILTEDIYLHKSAVTITFFVSVASPPLLYTRHLIKRQISGTSRVHTLH
jgi:hypothetical protein